MFQRVQLPAGISNLDTGLTDVDRDDFAHYVVLSLGIVLVDSRGMAGGGGGGSRSGGSSQLDRDGRALASASRKLASTRLALGC